VGKRNDEGKPLFDVIAELKTLFGLLDNVHQWYSTFMIVSRLYGKLEDAYFNFLFINLSEADMKLFLGYHIAIEVTNE
jgi:hypothetical protein